MEIAPFGYQIKNEIEIEPFDSFNVHVQIYKKRKTKKYGKNYTLYRNNHNDRNWSWYVISDHSAGRLFFFLHKFVYSETLQVSYVLHFWNKFATKWFCYHWLRSDVSAQHDTWRDVFFAKKSWKKNFSRTFELHRHRNTQKFVLLGISSIANRIYQKPTKKNWFQYTRTSMPPYLVNSIISKFTHYYLISC